MNEFNAVRGANASVHQEIEGWEEKSEDYIREFFNNDRQRVYGTRFGDNLAMVAEIAENALAEPDTFRGVRDTQGRLQAGAIVRQESDLLGDYLFLESFATAPWNILQNQPESLKGAGTSLIEELVNESRDLSFEGRVKLYAIPRAKQFYRDIGFVETDEGDWELTLDAAEAFLRRQERFRRTGRR